MNRESYDTLRGDGSTTADLPGGAAMSHPEVSSPAPRSWRSKDKISTGIQASVENADAASQCDVDLVLAQQRGEVLAKSHREVDEALDSLMERITELNQLKDDITLANALPTNILSKFTVGTSRLLRCKAVLHKAASELLEAGTWCSPLYVEVERRVLNDAKGLEMSVSEIQRAKRLGLLEGYLTVHGKELKNLLRWLRMSSRLKERQRRMEAVAAFRLLHQATAPPAATAVPRSPLRQGRAKKKEGESTPETSTSWDSLIYSYPQKVNFDAAAVAAASNLTARAGMTGPLAANLAASLKGGQLSAASGADSDGENAGEKTKSPRRRRKRATGKKGAGDAPSTALPGKIDASQAAILLAEGNYCPEETTTGEAGPGARDKGVESGGKSRPGSEEGSKRKPGSASSSSAGVFVGRALGAGGVLTYGPVGIALPKLPKAGTEPGQLTDRPSSQGEHDKGGKGAPAVVGSPPGEGAFHNFTAAEVAEMRSKMMQQLRESVVQSTTSFMDDPDGSIAHRKAVSMLTMKEIYTRTEVADIQLQHARQLHFLQTCFEERLRVVNDFYTKKVKSLSKTVDEQGKALQVLSPRRPMRGNASHGPKDSDLPASLASGITPDEMAMLSPPNSPPGVRSPRSIASPRATPLSPSTPVKSPPAPGATLKPSTGPLSPTPAGQPGASAPRIGTASMSEWKTKIQAASRTHGAAVTQAGQLAG